MFLSKINLAGSQAPIKSVHVCTYKKNAGAGMLNNRTNCHQHSTIRKLFLKSNNI